MIKVSIPSLLCLCLLFLNCNNTTKKSSNTNELPEVVTYKKDALDIIEEEQQLYIAKGQFFYVIVPNGLSLRDKKSLDSEKIHILPYGAKVKQLSADITADYEVEHIRGSMMEVKYQDWEGYAFSGFLSRIPVPKKNEETKDYMSRVKAVDSTAKVKISKTNPDFHQGTKETLWLPTSLPEAFYIAKAQYNIPNSFLFPGNSGAKEETIIQKDKEDYVWTSELRVSRNTSLIDSIQYNWRAEGGGYKVVISHTDNTDVKIVYTAYAD